MNLNDWVLVPVEPTLAMLENAWGICGTNLSSMEPNPEKIAEAQEKYKILLEDAARCRAGMNEQGQVIFSTI